MEDNPFPAIMGRVCYHPCETACNRGQLDEAVGIHSVERFLGDEAIKQGWTRRGRRAEPSRQAGAGRRRRALGPVGRLPPDPHGPRRDDPRRRPDGRRHDALRHPQVPAAARRARCRGRSGSSTWASSWSSNRKVTERRSRTMREGGFDAAFLAVGAHIGKRAYVPAGEAARILDAVSMLHSMEGEERPLLGRRVVVYGGGNTAMDAARTAKRLGATEAIVVYRRTRERMPAHDFEVEEAEEEGVMMKWLSTIKHADEGKLVIERMELDETGFPQPTGELEELEADSLVLALGQEADLSLLDGVPGIEVEDGVVAGRPEHDDRPPGDLRRRRHGPGRAHRHRRRRPRQEGRAPHRRLAARRRATSRRRSTSWRPSTRSTPGTTPTRRAPSSPSSRPRAGARPSTRSSAASTSRTPSTRRAAACRAAPASPATTATASAPTTP